MRKKKIEEYTDDNGDTYEVWECVLLDFPDNLVWSEDIYIKKVTIKKGESTDFKFFDGELVR